jgi:hypothetical protein
MNITSRFIAGAAVSALAVGFTAPAAMAHGGHRHHAAPVVNSRPVVVDEGAGTATVTITLRRAAKKDISLDWSTLSRGFKTYRGDFRHQARELSRLSHGHRGHHRIGRATAGEDYTASNGTVVIAAGSKTASVTVPVTDDTTVEPSEIFLVRFRATKPAEGGTARTAHAARGAFASHLRGHHQHFRHSLTVPVLITDNDTATSAS